MKLKDRAKEKAERRGVRNSAPDSQTKGPAIAWDQPGGVNSLADENEPGIPTDDAKAEGAPAATDGAPAAAPAPGPASAQPATPAPKPAPPQNSGPAQNPPPRRR